MVVMGGCSQTFGGPLRASVGGDPCHRGSQGWCSRQSNGGRVPQLPANPPLLLQHSVWAGGVLTVGFAQTGQCLLPCQSSSRPSHTHTHTRTKTHTHTHTRIHRSRHKLPAVPTPSPRLAPSPPRLLIISLANASHSTVYCLHCFGLCIIYTVN